MDDRIRTDELSLYQGNLSIAFHGWIEGEERPLMHLGFRSREDERILPVQILFSHVIEGKTWFSASCRFDLKYAFSAPMKPGEEAELFILMAESGEEISPGNVSNCQITSTMYECKLSDRHCVIRRVQASKSMERRYEKPPAGIRMYRGLLFIFFLLLVPLWILEGLLADLGYLPFVNSDIERYHSRKSRILRNMNERLLTLTGHGISPTACKTWIFRMVYRIHAGKKRKGTQPTILFLSVRSSRLTGNMKCVYDACEQIEAERIVQTPGKEIKNMGIAQVWRIGKSCGRADLIILDDRTSFIDDGQLLPETKVLQLWHACGAFKTFGFSRLGKDLTVKESDTNHRRYDYAIVSSERVRSCYAEGFGIPVSHVVATGIPRTDHLLDKEYRKKAREAVYHRYPAIKGKRIFLFAPTFRGNGKVEAYYPMERLDLEHLLRALPPEACLLIRHHPFVKEKQPIPESCRGRVFDAADFEDFNELLSCAELLITDYSSAVFEAALMDIPMIFYVFDLAEYTSTRDFYYPYRSFVPGKIVESQEELEAAIRDSDFEEKKILKFREKFFDHPGSAAGQVVELIKKIVLKRNI